jgi:hypothetical protein
VLEGCVLEGCVLEGCVLEGCVLALTDCVVFTTLALTDCVVFTTLELGCIIFSLYNLMMRVFISIFYKW